MVGYNPTLTSFGTPESQELNQKNVNQDKQDKLAVLQVSGYGTFHVYLRVASDPNYRRRRDTSLVYIARKVCECTHQCYSARSVSETQNDRILEYEATTKTALGQGLNLASDGFAARRTIGAGIPIGRLCYNVRFSSRASS